jgi:hypothetical protein
MINKLWFWYHKESILKESTCVKMSFASGWVSLFSSKQEPEPCIDGASAAGGAAGGRAEPRPHP